jgi:hypothetical protein
MILNRFLELIARTNDTMHSNLLQLMRPVFPTEAVTSYNSASGVARRDRVFTNERTLLTMVVTALHEDRSLRTSVNIFREAFRQSCNELREEFKADIATRDTTKQCKAARGRPRSRKPELPTSKTQDISSNTAAFSQARDRLDQGLIDHVFAATRDFEGYGCVLQWHGRNVFNTDGTYFQMQDTADIPDKYRTQKNADGTLQGYPQGLLQILTQHGSGAIYSYRIGGRDGGEMDILCDMLDDLPKSSLLLADDLYNCYALYDLLLQRHIDIIAPDKKQRKYRVLRRIGRGDELVELTRPSAARQLTPDHELSTKITLRRICFRNTNDPRKTHVLYTTILDKSISRVEIIKKYATRWDIEISIREIKTIMGINIARSKSEEMVFREIGVALLAYNLVRKIIAKGAQKASFPPKENILQVLYPADTSTLVDRKGRVYARWSPGRPVARNCSTQSVRNPGATRKELSEEN